MTAHFTGPFVRTTNTARTPSPSADARTTSVLSRALVELEASRHVTSMSPYAKRLEIIGGCLPPVVHLVMDPSPLFNGKTTLI